MTRVDPLVVIEAMRPRQWVKNLLVVAAPAAATALGEPGVAVRTTLAFVVFTLAAGATYLGNDATDADIDALEARIGRRLPSAFRAHLRVHGRGGPYLFEYTTLDVDRIAYVWEMLESLRGEGAFDSYVPCELRDTDEAVERVWWHPGWVPFAEDSCGNLWCVDLAPRGKPGCYGQVIAWETHSGPVGPAGAGFDFCDYLEGHRDKLVEGRAVVMDGGSVIEQ